MKHVALPDHAYLLVPLLLMFARCAVTGACGCVGFLLMLMYVVACWVPNDFMGESPGRRLVHGIMLGHEVWSIGLLDFRLEGMRRKPKRNHRVSHGELPRFHEVAAVSSAIVNGSVVNMLLTRTIDVLVEGAASSDVPFLFASPSFLVSPISGFPMMIKSSNRESSCELTIYKFSEDFRCYGEYGGKGGNGVFDVTYNISLSGRARLACGQGSSSQWAPTTSRDRLFPSESVGAAGGPERTLSSPATVTRAFPSASLLLRSRCCPSIGGQRRRWRQRFVWRVVPWMVCLSAQMFGECCQSLGDNSDGRWRAASALLGRRIGEAAHPGPTTRSLSHAPALAALDDSDGSVGSWDESWIEDCSLASVPPCPSDDHAEVDDVDNRAPDIHSYARRMHPADRGLDDFHLLRG